MPEKGSLITKERPMLVVLVTVKYCRMHQTVEVSSTVVTIWLGMLILAAVSGIASFHEVVWSSMCVASQVCVNMHELEQTKLGKN